MLQVCVRNISICVGEKRDGGGGGGGSGGGKYGGRVAVAPAIEAG
jgi:hypothetical protein